MRLALALLAFAASGAASAEQGAPSADAPKDAATPAQSAPPAAMSHHPAAACAEAKVDCAATAVPAFAKDGRLWVAFSVGKSLYAAASSDNGATFSAPTAIATIGDGVIDAHGDARPKIVALKDGTLLASYTTRPDKQMIGTIFTARSTDGGKTFSAPQALLAEGGQRFDSILVNRKGRIYAGWLDKTHALKAKAEGKEFLGSGVAFAYSDDGGKTFKGKSILHRSRLRMLPHVRRARQGRNAGLRLATGAGRQCSRPYGREALRGRRASDGDARFGRRLGDQ